MLMYEQLGPLQRSVTHEKRTVLHRACICTIRDQECFAYLISRGDLLTRLESCFWYRTHQATPIVAQANAALKVPRLTRPLRAVRDLETEQDHSMKSDLHNLKTCRLHLLGMEYIPGNDKKWGLDTKVGRAGGTGYEAYLARFMSVRRPRASGARP